MAEKKGGIPAALLIPGMAHHEEPDEDTDTDEEYQADEELGNELIRSMKSGDGEGVADVVHQLVEECLRKHHLLKEDESDAGDLEEQGKEELGQE
jgi:hypothetical protein